jgi:hypothetical protein
MARVCKLLGNLGVTLVAATLAACSGGSGGAAPRADGTGPDGPVPDEHLDPGTPVQVSQSELGLADIEPLLDEARQLDAVSLAERYQVPFSTELGYEPTDAVGLDLIQSSNLALRDSELAALSRNGFAILARQQFPHFSYAYSSVYAEDLPVFISADSILEALHRSYDDILTTLELGALVPQLGRLLESMRAGLAAAEGLSAEVAGDVDFFLTVAQSLLDGQSHPPVTVIDATEVEEFLAAANSASGMQERELFGVLRRIDFSQFEPRGHYENDPVLQRYFRAMMWLGRIDFRLLETQSDHSQVFRRRQLEAALGLRQLMDASAVSDWASIDAAITAFVGEHDYMTVPELDQLLADLGASSLADLAAVSDEVIAQAIVDGGYGTQRIASHIMVNGLAQGTMPLSSSFAFFGQRYVVDSHVFSNVVYDRAGGGEVLRVLPDPLDAAFAAFGNDQAISLLEQELAEYPYAADLAAMRVLVDAHPETYWDSSLYTLWLGTLRTLSPTAPSAGPEASGLPTVATTEPWGRRLLNTQLGSWAELRHDTLLYAKQSYAMSTVCVFPDAYVDPYPELFAKLVRFAERGEELVTELDLLTNESAGRVSDYFATLASVSTTLQQMAEHQRTGLAHSEEHLAFVNNAVRIHSAASGPPSIEGWYHQLFYNYESAMDFDPTIADVHTDPGGEIPPRPPSVLHVGTGLPRLMALTVDSCEGPHAYLGPVSAYHEHLAEGLTR